MTVLLSQHPDRYLRDPQFVEGGLSCIVWNVQSGTEFRHFWPFETLAHGDVPSTAYEPFLCQARDSEWIARCAGASVEIRHSAGVASVLLHQGDVESLVWRAQGVASSPAVIRGHDGFLVAWHHNVREDSFEVDVAKWIALRKVSAGRVLEISAPMLDRDRDMSGEEQSFEFPSLVEHADGAVSILGRGSHSFWRQDLGSTGFSNRFRLGEAGWGSRGRHCVAAIHKGTLWTARREREGIVIESEAAVSKVAGAPIWNPARIDITRVQGPRVSTRTSVEYSPKRLMSEDVAPTGMRTFFGDIQQHSAHSDGVGSADEVYLRARDIYEDDFVALTDHESFLGKRTGPSEWEYLKDVANGYDDPGTFATLLAYEWTSKRHPGPGHKCVYVPDKAPIVSRDDYPEGGAFITEARRRGFFAAPHHIGWTGCDEEGHAPDIQPFWEICSCHGCYEEANNPLGYRGEHDDQLAYPMLMRGHRFGFSGSSDSHGLLWHHGESRKRDPYRTGLVAVQAEELTRAAVMGALRQRRCYATSGKKILLDFSADGAPMGSELPSLAKRLVGKACGTAMLDAIELVTDLGVVALGVLDGVRGGLEFEPRETLRFAYLRVRQVDGEMAWSSPIFFGSKNVL